MSMIRVTKLTVRNLGPIADAEIDLAGKPLVIFYGEVRQGKTTILNAVRWALGGAFPDDIIRHGCEEASAKLDFTEDGIDGWASRSWYIAKGGALKAREQEFVRHGEKSKGRVADAVKALLNPFQMKQGFFSDMNETERRKYMAELFGADNPKEDAELLALDSKAKELRAVLTGFGEIDLTAPPTAVDTANVRAEIQRVQDEHRKQVEEVQESNRVIQEHNSQVDKGASLLPAWKKEMLDVEQQIKTLESKRDALAERIMSGTAWLADPKNTKHETIAQPTAPDTSELHAKLATAAADEVRREQYASNQKRATQREAKRTELSTAEARQKELKSAKIKRLAEVGSKSGVTGLAFAEDGTFTFEGTAAGMLSTSQIMRLSESLSALYPEGFGLSLVDRGESLGKSIFALIERATAEDKTILATVVGEKPAKTPDGVGVFVVENGKVTQ